MLSVNADILGNGCIVAKVHDHSTIDSYGEETNRHKRLFQLTRLN